MFLVFSYKNSARQGLTSGIATWEYHKESYSAKDCTAGVLQGLKVTLWLSQHCPWCMLHNIGLKDPDIGIWQGLPCNNYRWDGIVVRGANMGPIWGRQDPGGTHVGPMNYWRLSIRLWCLQCISKWITGPWWQGSWGQHGAHLGPTGPRWDPCWPHELCYLGILVFVHVQSWS